MSNMRSFQQKLAKVFRHWKDEQHDLALDIVEDLLKSWQGNAQLHVLRASLIQLQEKPSHGLEEARKALRNAIDLDTLSPAAQIELGHFLDAVDDDPQAAALSFAEGNFLSRRLLIDGLLGQARALLQLEKKDEAVNCLVEALYLANIAGKDERKSAASDILLRDASGQLLAVQVKGPFATKVEDLLEELFPKRSA